MSKLTPLSGRVVVVGDVMQDIMVHPEGPVRTGSDQNARISLQHGGSAANQAMALAGAGVETLFIGRVGAADADALAHRMNEMGIKAVLGRDDSLQTGRLVCLIAPDGERSFLTDRGANAALSASDIPPDWVEGTGLLQVSAYALFEPGPRAAVLGMIDEAKRQGIVTGIDASSTGYLQDVGIGRFLGWVDGVDVLFANEEEAALLSGVETLSDQFDVLTRHFGLVVIKRGEAGAAAASRGGEPLSADAQAVRCLNTTGAGDAFLAGFVARWRRQPDLMACLEAGNLAGAKAVTRIGAQS